MSRSKKSSLKDRSPAMQFYFRQFSGDEEVMGMDLDTIGAHILLMCVAGAANSGFRIRYNRDAIRNMIRNPNDADFDRIMTQLLRGAWKISDDGEWIEQHGMMRSLLKQKEFSKAQSERAKGNKNARRMNAEKTPDERRMVRRTNAQKRSSSSSSLDQSRSTTARLTPPVENASNSLVQFGFNVQMSQKQYKGLLSHFTKAGLTEEHLREAITYFENWLAQGNTHPNHPQAILGIPMRRVMEKEAAKLEMQRKQELLKRVK